MTNKQPHKTSLPDDFSLLLADIKACIQTAQTRAMLAVNSELVRLYWDIGRIINARQQQEGWGTGVIPRLAVELKNELPELKGFSERNIKYMLAFHREYPNPPAVLPQVVAKLEGINLEGSQPSDREVVTILQQPVAKLQQAPPVNALPSDDEVIIKVQQPAAQLEQTTSKNTQLPDSEAVVKVQQPVAQLDGIPILQQTAAKLSDSLLWQIPWAHHITLMEKVKDLATRCWYMEQTIANGWSRNVLSMQISTQAHARYGKAQSNFALTLPEHQSDLVQQTLKDPYIFDFLTLTEPFHERELETELVRHLEHFLLELGQGFAFVGRQHKVEVGDEDFYIDLLFYHLRLRAFVVIELKKGKFKPEYAGKLNFYCNVINDQLKQATDNPTIGLILCQERSRLLAEYSFAGIDKPIGISTYELTRALPEEIQSALPTVEQIEAELSEVTKQTENNKQESTIQEPGTRYDEGAIRIVKKPFDATDGAETPFGRRWGVDVATLKEAHLAALAAGKTLAFDVQSEYVLFVQALATASSEPTVAEEVKAMTPSLKGESSA